MIVEKPGYVLEVAADGLRATLSPVGEEPWLTLRPHAAFDTVDGVDETLSVADRRSSTARIVIERRSTLWDRAAVTIECTDDAARDPGIASPAKAVSPTPTCSRCARSCRTEPPGCCRAATRSGG